MNGKSKPLDRILETASVLFYMHDSNAVGVDTVCREADVSKRTLYKYFPTKNELITAALKTQANLWANRFETIRSDDPSERIVSIFKLLEAYSKEAAYNGCPMMNTSIELRDTDAPARAVAQGFKDILLSYFKQQAELLKLDKPQEIAEQLLVVYDGCNAWVMMRGTFPSSAIKTVKLLITQPGK